MEFDLIEDQRLFYETTTRFLETEAPIAKVREWVSSDLGYDEGWWSKGSGLGWTSLTAPEAHGGGSISGRPLQDLGLVAHAFGRGVVPGPLVGVNLVLLALAAAPGAVQDRLVPDLMNGVAVAGWAVDEPGSHDQLDVIEATATPTGDGGYRLDGVKLPVEAGASSSWFLVAARTGDGVGLFVVPAGAAGLTVTALGSLDLNRKFAEVRLDGVQVPAADVVAADADALVDRLRRAGRVLRLAETVGAIERIFELTCEWAFDRYSFGRPLASYQELKHRFADMKVWLEVSHATTDGAIAALDGDDSDAALLVHVAAGYVGDHAVELVQDCVQMFGGIGVTYEHDVHFFLRRVTQNRGLVGPPPVHHRRVTDIVEARA